MLELVISLVRLLANIELAVYLIISFFGIAVFSLLFLGGSRFFGGLSAHAPTLLTSLGITFTFMGVLRGLLDFDLNNIDAGITELLEGLKIAFVSSVLGISLAFIFRLIDLMTQTGYDSGDNIFSVMRTGFKEIAESIGGSGETSLAVRLEALQNSFDTKLDYLTESMREFMQEVVDKGTEALMQALTDVIREFNVKITEQFGENLARFNDGIGEFLAWQEKNRQELNELTASFASVRASLEMSAEKMADIAGHTSKIPEHMDALQRTQKIFQEEMEQLHSALGTLAEVRVKAQEVLPTLEMGLSGLLKQLENTNIQATETVTGLVGEMTNLKGETSSALTGAQNLISTVAEGLQVTIAEAQQSLKKATEEGIAGISVAITQLDNSMQEEVQRCVEVMGNNVTRITEEFVNQYERLAKDTQSVKAVRDSLETNLAKKVADRVKKITATG